MAIQRIYDIGLVPKQEELPERFMFPFSQMNWLLNGGLLDRVTLVSSSTDSGKTTFVSQIIENIIEQDYNCCCFFGEDTPYESQDRIFKQSLKKDEGSLEYKTYRRNGKDTNCGEFVLGDEAFESAKKRFESKLYLYNTKASATVDEILLGFEEARTKHNCKIFVLDNADQFDFSTENENKAMKDIVIKIRDYAINYKVHIFLVVHIRKLNRETLMPNLDDIKGTSSLVNIAKNVLIILRTDKMDASSKQYKALKKVVEFNNYDLDEADCLVYVAKTKGRALGYFTLKYNRKTNTYYDCKKIDENRKVEEKPTLFVKQADMTEIDDEDLPF